jgi:hypothetical protein
MKPILIGTTYEGNRPEFLKKLLPVVDFLEFSPDSLATSYKGWPVLIHRSSKN